MNSPLSFSFPPSREIYFSLARNIKKKKKWPRSEWTDGRSPIAMRVTSVYNPMQFLLSTALRLSLAMDSSVPFHLCNILRDKMSVQEKGVFRAYYKSTRGFDAPIVILLYFLFCFLFLQPLCNEQLTTCFFFHLRERRKSYEISPKRILRSL